MLKNHSFETNQYASRQGLINILFLLAKDLDSLNPVLVDLNCRIDLTRTSFNQFVSFVIIW